MRVEAKARGFKGFSTLNKDQLQCLLNGERVLYTLKRNQICVETQTEFIECDKCIMKTIIYREKARQALEKRKAELKYIKIGDGLEFNLLTADCRGQNALIK